MVYMVPLECQDFVSTCASQKQQSDCGGCIWTQRFVLVSFSESLTETRQFGRIEKALSPILFKALDSVARIYSA